MCIRTRSLSSQMEHSFIIIMCPRTTENIKFIYSCYHSYVSEDITTNLLKCFLWTSFSAKCCFNRCTCACNCSTLVESTSDESTPVIYQVMIIISLTSDKSHTNRRYSKLWLLYHWPRTRFIFTKYVSSYSAFMVYSIDVSTVLTAFRLSGWKQITVREVSLQHGVLTLW